MSENKNPQENGNNWFAGIWNKRPSLEQVKNGLVWMLESTNHLHAPIAGLMMYWIAINFIRYLPTQAGMEHKLDYFLTVFAGFPLIAVVIVVLAGFESLRRNEMLDTAKVLFAIFVNYLAITLGGNLMIVVLAYAFGYAVVNEASRHGKTDYTPMVAYHGAFIGLVASTFGFGAISLIWPVLVAVIFELVEINRSKDYMSMRLAVPGFIIALIGVVFMANPTWWIVAGAIVSFVVTPTVVKVIHLHFKKYGSFLKTCETPLESWDNAFKHLKINFEAAMLTLVGSVLMVVLMLML